MLFEKPEQLNGETLIAELTKIGVYINEVVLNGEGKLELEVDEKDKIKVQDALLNHDGSPTTSKEIVARKSALAKLAKLGLTEDEIAAL